MLKVDKLRILQLASEDESLRVHAAEDLAKLEAGHFEDHPVSQSFVKNLKSALLNAHRQTTSQLVREWVTQVLADAGAEGEDIHQLVVEALVPNCGYLPTLLYYIYTKAHRFHSQKEQIKSLCGHADDEVRWRCALVLEKMPLSYESDVACLRLLAVDPYYTTRTYAVLAFSKIGARSPEDLRVLKKVVEIDNGAAKTYASGMLSASA
jgi:hypothetical protein